MICVGARPNFIKASPIIKELKEKQSSFDVVILHTGQHYSDNMSSGFFKELSIPRPDINLSVGSATGVRQMILILERLEKVLLKNEPDLVMVFGDVNSTLACALAAAKLKIKIAHVESGLRSFDITMPEEINRLLTDHLSDILFTTCVSANKNLAREGVDKKKIFFVGNTMIDSLMQNEGRIKRIGMAGRLGLKRRDYAVLTLHRPGNVDRKTDLKKIMRLLKTISHKIKVVFPAHPRTIKMMRKYGLLEKLRKNTIVVKPLGYTEFLSLVHDSKLVLTDSGGIQEEAAVLRIPCLTLRKNTERPVTIERGTNILVGLDKKKVMWCIDEILKNSRKTKKSIRLWDGKSAKRIVKVLMNISRKNG